MGQAKRNAALGRKVWTVQAGACLLQVVKAHDRKDVLVQNGANYCEAMWTTCTANGLPPDAVILQTIQDGANPNVIHFVIGSSLWPVVPDHMKPPQLQEIPQMTSLFADQLEKMFDDRKSKAQGPGSEGN